ncbi:unnamed protein product [Allacma fusca]|uniref:EF-hand domain-containing protein n=1 Tax=Allacma fusca TaxID=39272 RepID=A0A8J2PVI3_9HEXA|nr:unnamed protein product [Allacma fusca]
MKSITIPLFSISWYCDFGQEKTKMASPWIICTLVFVSIHVAHVSGQCCRADRIGDIFSLVACADRSAATPCCAYGSCNFFCCNCDGGCRQENRGKRSLNQTDVSVYHTFKSLDENGDGGVDKREVTRFIRRSRRSAEDFSFASYDKNGDGLLSAHEIDSSPEN